MLHRPEKRVLEFIHLHGLFAGAKEILLAVSGGADSIALLHILASLRTKRLIEVRLTCAHINHKLRGSAGDGDEEFVVAQAAELGLPVVTRAVDVRTYARTHKLSIETAGRQLRLACFREMARERGCDWVATGHQKNDNAETIIDRLRRGTGFRGLAGIWPVRRFDDDLWLARPLLCVTREEIIQYLEKRKLPWREDRTNVDLAYRRNVIRHRLLPALQQESRRNLVTELSGLAAVAKKLYDRIREEANEARSRLVTSADAGVAIGAPGLALLPEPVAVELVRQALADLGCDEGHLTQYHYKGVLRLARQRTGGKEILLPGGFAARYACEQIILSIPEPSKACGAEFAPPKAATETAPANIQVPGRTHFAEYEIDARILDRREVGPDKIKGDKSRFCEYFDLDRLQQPVIVRPRLAGDRFWPLGLAGEKKVGKFLTTAKVPQEMRERILVFADREKIIWVCPVRISEQAKITGATRWILSLMVSKRQPAEKPGRLDREPQ